MPEITMDIAVANRFISSLSKSLQALCHGCMEFETGIEIIGYININIDSGSKVDYVLNEKVLKSTNNSMTFVSNSFLAKKEQQRHTRDGSCSPIPTSSIPHHPTPIYQARQRGSNYGASFHRSSQFSSHSQVLHGGQKRQWGSDWRNSAKKHRPASTSSELPSFSSHASPYTPSSHTFTDTNYKQSSAPTSTDSNNEGENEVIKIKKEALDTDTDAQDQNIEQDQSNEDQISDTSCKVKIKCDPDAVQPVDDETNNEDIVSAKESTDFKGTFLDPSHGTSDEQDISNSEKTSETKSRPGQSVSDEHNVAGPSTEDAEESDEIVHRGENSGADMPLDYDQGNEDYPQSVQSDAGEASSDTGQFEVIEIDDEDEDVQAMFGDSQVKLNRRQGRRQRPTLKYKEYVANPMLASNRHVKHSSLPQTQIPNQMIPCSLCSEVFTDNFCMKSHFSRIHGHLMPFTCSLCGKGYQTSMGLRYHMQAHQGQIFACPICHCKLTRKFSLKMHLRNVHNSVECLSCSGIFTQGTDYNNHVLSCAFH